jgi:hypothetical protein
MSRRLPFRGIWRRRVPPRPGAGSTQPAVTHSSGAAVGGRSGVPSPATINSLPVATHREHSEDHPQKPDDYQHEWIDHHGHLTSLEHEPWLFRYYYAILGLILSISWSANKPILVV